MVETLHASWGKRLRRYRTDRSLSQEHLATLCAVRQSTISRVEAGISCPSDRVKWLLAGALGCTVEELFPYPPVRPPVPQPEELAS